MSTLSKAPLIEVIFEMRWGTVKRTSDRELRIEFSKEEEEIFPGRFSALAEKNGFVTRESINTDVPDIAGHIVHHRFRKEPNTWPCFQIGTGIFTTNQVNDGYDWTSFKQSILLGLTALSEAHPSGLEKLPLIGVELRFQDGFFLDESENPLSFLKNKMAFDFQLPAAFTSSKGLSANVEATNIGFQIQTTEPDGLLILNVVQALINGRPGFVMDTRVRSAVNKSPRGHFEVIMNWLERAHILQKHAFTTLIEPSYLRSFK